MVFSLSNINLSNINLSNDRMVWYIVPHCMKVYPVYRKVGQTTTTPKVRAEVQRAETVYGGAIGQHRPVTTIMQAQQVNR